MKTMKICKCGKIHLIDDGKIDNAINKNKEFVFICADCGQSFVFGSDIEIYQNKRSHMMYTYELSKSENQSITKESFQSTEERKGIEEIYYSHGIKVPMMTGYSANCYMFGVFSDERYPDLYKIERKDITAKMVMDFLNKWRKDRVTVNMNRFIQENCDEDLEIISRYLIDGFDWKGTKFEKEWS